MIYARESVRSSGGGGRERRCGAGSAEENARWGGRAAVESAARIRAEKPEGNPDS